MIKTFAISSAIVAGLAMSAVAMAPQKDIVDTAVEAGSFKTLVSLVKTAGLVETLKGKGPFTVFAPTDAAFAKVPKATLNALGNDKKALQGVLTYHVVAGNVMAADVVKLNGKKVKTVNGAELNIAVRGGKVFLNNVEVVKTDIKTSNGVIHVINGVLLPPAKRAANEGGAVTASTKSGGCGSCAGK